ncbi:MAG TPA: lmo0937 family membrane protein [Cyclobacteriaceae bacterium]|nr:lmo0937 family membrane protein [Cyclobacteriaceae bacterium]
MANFLYAIAVVLVIVWLIGFIGLAAGGMIHALLLIAVIAVLLNIIVGSRRNI